MDWNPSDPIESMVDCLKDCYVFAVYMGPPYTLEQLIKRVHMQVKKCGLFPTAIVEFKAFDEDQKTWP